MQGAVVSFLLPEDGASGQFINGSRTEIVSTQADGRATVWGMRWNKTPGTVTIRITAAKDGVRAGIISTQYLDSAAAVQSAKAPAHKSHLMLITIAIAGAAGAGLAAGALRGSKTTAATPAAAAISIGTPTATVGGPQ